MTLPGYDPDFVNGVYAALQAAQTPPPDLVGPGPEKVFPEPATTPEEPIPEPEPENVPETPADTESGRERVKQLLGDHADLVLETAKETGIDPILLGTILHIESSGDPEAVSEKGARGLFQLTPAAISDVGMDPDEVLGDPKKEAVATAKYLQKLQDKYGAKNLDEIFAAYNAGPDVVGKSPEEWPEESRHHAEKGMAFYAKLAGLNPEEQKGEPAREKPSAAGENTPESGPEPRDEPETRPGEAEEPGETPVDESGEPITDTEGNPVLDGEGNPVSEAEVSESPVAVAERISGPAQSLSEEQKAALDEYLKKMEMPLQQRLGIAILAVNNPQIAGQIIAQHEAAKAGIIRAAMQGETWKQQQQAIQQRQEAQEEGRIFRNQVAEYGRQRRELVDQMVKDGIPIDKSKLPPAVIRTPQDLEKAQRQLQEQIDAYAEAKSIRQAQEQKAKDITAATEATRKGGLGSEQIKAKYPKWKDDPQLRSLVETLQKQEEANQKMADAERERLLQQAEAARTEAARSAADVDRIRASVQTDRARAAVQARDAAGRIAGQIRQIDEQIAMLQIGMQNTWSPWRREAYNQTLQDLLTTRQNLSRQLEELNRIAEQAESGESEEQPRPRASVDDLYNELRGAVALIRGRHLPGGDEGATIQWFIDNALKTGHVGFINKYGPAVVRMVFQQALKITRNRPLARQLTERWLRDVTTGAPWYKRPLPAVEGEEGAEKRVLDQLNTVYAGSSPAGGNAE